MRLTYAPTVDATYLYLVDESSRPVERTEVTASGLLLDFDAEGRLLGIECLDATRCLHPLTLAKAIRI